MSVVVDEARQNEVAAYAKYQDEHLRISGEVIQTGLDSFSHVVGTLNRDEIVTTGDKVERYPYVLISSSGSAAKNFVKCYFDTMQLELVAKIVKHSSVVLGGYFQEYVHDGESVVLVLNSCVIE